MTSNGVLEPVWSSCPIYQTLWWIFCALILFMRGMRLLKRMNLNINISLTVMSDKSDRCELRFQQSYVNS